MAPKQLPIRLPADVRRRLEAEARRLEFSLNAVIVMYLDRYLPPANGETPPPAEPPAAPPAAPPAKGKVLDFDD